MLTQGPIPDPKCELITSSFIRLSYFYQECHVHCIVITIDRGEGLDGGWVIYIRMGRQGVGIIL